MNALAFSFSVTFPIFSLLLLGAALRRWHWIDEGFVQTGSKLVFNLALPLVLFLSISDRSTFSLLTPSLILAGVTLTLALWWVCEWLARCWVHPARDRGVVVQGVYRANMGIVGLAYCIAAYGEQGLQAASLYLAVVTILFNVIAVITLSRSLNREAGIRGAFVGMLQNPLIIAIVIALVFAAADWRLPTLIQDSAAMVASMALPLALLCTGGSISWVGLRAERVSLGLAVAGKLMLAPVLAVAVGLGFGLSTLHLGVLVMMASAPTAVASYVMVRAMGGNSGLAANIVSVTTLAAMLSVTVVLAVLRSLSLI